MAPFTSPCNGHVVVNASYIHVTRLAHGLLPAQLSSGTTIRVGSNQSRRVGCRIDDMPESAMQTREQVLLAAADAGFPITGDQLARWHRAGLLPHPRQRALGRGLGTVTIYPPGTVEQLLALCRIRQQHRSLTRAAFKLWWDGFPVEEDQVRGPLTHAATKLDSDLAGTTKTPQGPAKGLTAAVNRRLGRKRTQALDEAIRTASLQSSAPLSPSQISACHRCHHRSMSSSP